MVNNIKLFSLGYRRLVSISLKYVAPPNLASRAQNLINYEKLTTRRERESTGNKM